MSSFNDTMILVEKLEDLKDFAREHLNKCANPLLYRRSLHYQRVWKKLRSVENKILRTAYTRNISLVIGNETLKFVQMVHQKPTSNRHFEMYLRGQFSCLWENALTEFISLHEKWNQLMNEIITENF
jgi:hypothetical protein